MELESGSLEALIAGIKMNHEEIVTRTQEVAKKKLALFTGDTGRTLQRLDKAIDHVEKVFDIDDGVFRPAYTCAHQNNGSIASWSGKAQCHVVANINAKVNAAMALVNAQEAICSTFTVFP
ncbi:hypothetical protein KCU95_g5659, partial [Aureobasidium melanogenum]